MLTSAKCNLNLGAAWPDSVRVFSDSVHLRPGSVRPPRFGATARVRATSQRFGAA